MEQKFGKAGGLISRAALFEPHRQLEQQINFDVIRIILEIYQHYSSLKSKVARLSSLNRILAS